MVLIRDGAFPAINATNKIHTRNLEKQFCILFAKWAAGCSMTQSFNDAGFMHKNLHSLFSSNHYRYDDVTDPPGEVYGQLKQYLQLYLEPASLRTVWKCFCSAESIIDKACTELNVMSALKSTGVTPRDNKPILGKNPEFGMLTDRTKIDKVLNCIDHFTDLYDQKGMVMEEEYDEYFLEDDDIDTQPPRVGMPLNEMSTNRQRFLIDSHPQFLLEVSRKRLIAEEAAAEKLARAEARRTAADNVQNNAIVGVVAVTTSWRRCSNPVCCNKISMKSKNAEWSKCQTKRCNTWVCSENNCKAILQQHIIAQHSPAVV